MANSGCWAGRGLQLVLSLWLMAGCGPAEPIAPEVQEASGTLEAAETAAPIGPTTPPPSPTVVAPTDTPLPALPAPGRLLAWAVAYDGAVFVLDEAPAVYELSPLTLEPLARSAPLFVGSGEESAYLSASEGHVFVGTSAISQTVVLARTDLGVSLRLEAFGPMALDPAGRLLLVPQGLEQTWPTGNYEVWAYDLKALDRPPEVVLGDPGASIDGLVVDAARRRLILQTSNPTASPPHRGQNYQIHDLDSGKRLATAEWERGSLTRPAIQPRTGEIAGSRIGLNGTRRFLVLDEGGAEERNRPAIDGQPAIDAAGEWVYLLRQRGVWVLGASDLSLQSALPFSRTAPRDLILSPDGERLYLFGEGWLSALATAELRGLGTAPVRRLPVSWFAVEETEQAVQPRIYPSPQMTDDGTVFLQLVGEFEIVMETYRSTDGGESWNLLPAMLEPERAGASFLALSPDFATDQTMTALKGSSQFRSTDGGLSWEPWQSRIAFVSDRAGSRDLYTMDREGDDVRRLTDWPGAEENPAWSPAWTRLAFQSDVNGNWDLFTMRQDCDLAADGTAQDCDLVQLTDDPGDDLLPAWSPDGRRLAFVSTRDGNPEIYVMDADGGRTQRLTFHPGGDWRPAWTPDSQHLVFTSDRNGNNDLFQLTVPDLEAAPVAGEPEVVPLVVSPGDDRDPAVSAGLLDRVLFLSDRDGTMRTYTLDPTSPPRPFAETQRSEAHPSTLPGEVLQILVSVEVEGSMDVFRAGFLSYTPLAASPGFDGHPAGEATGWKPDKVASLDWLAGGW